VINDRFYIKIVPQRGDTVHRFEIRKRHIVAALGAIAIVVLGSVTFAAVQVAHARAQVEQLQAQAQQQRQTLTSIDRATDSLKTQLQRVQHENQEIRQLIGVPEPRPAARVQKTSWVRGDSLVAAAARVAALKAASAETARESARVQSLALHVLNLRHIADIARAQMIAAIPSIDPVDGAQVVGCYCYRTYPDVEFHPGVDLAADYGQTVRAAAAGTIASAGWDGNYGIKIDIDHGNGYHTWYAHLSRVDVEVGSRVYKGESIAQAGATGFATGPHLHYQVMYQGQAIDPTPFLHGVPANVLASLP
jgi:murein DD-endopeptidase MepM/ murein hydrolase activator NlpD